MCNYLAEYQIGKGIILVGPILGGPGLGPRPPTNEDIPPK